MRLRIRHPLHLEYHHWEHHWDNIWLAAIALALAFVGLPLLFAGYVGAGLVTYVAALVLGFYATMRMGRYNKED